MKRRLLWTVVVACAAWTCAGPTDTPATLVSAPDAVAEIRTPELKLRKLYLVRPDLMAYPVPYDVVC